MSEGNVRIVSVRYAGDHKLDVMWNNRKAMTVDFSAPIYRLKGLRPLRDSSVFARAHVGESGYTVEWSDEIDMAADRVLEMGLEQAGRADAVEFIRWRWRNELSLTAAAEALDIGRRTVAYYSSGEHDVPRTILLACKGWEAERKSVSESTAA